MSDTASTAPTAPSKSLTLGAVSLREELAIGMKPLGAVSSGGLTVDVRLGRDSLWALIGRGGAPAMALRCAHAPGGGVAAKRLDDRRWRMQAAAGVWEVDLGFEAAGDHALLRCRTTVTPAVDLLIPFLPRDLYPLSDGDPGAAKGRVEAAQRGLNSGLLYLTLREPDFGAALYFQNLTALNPYFEAVDSKPDGVVGGEWPELGYLPPASPAGNNPPTRPLKADKPVLLSDALIAFEAKRPKTEQQIAGLFLDLLGAVYPHLDRPTPEHHDWPGRADGTLRDLARSPKATIDHYGHRYIHPYTDAEYPDSMVQLAVLRPIREFGDWRGRPDRLGDELAAGLGRFFDKELGVIRRYLPNVGDDKDADAVDSWYLYHPLMNLARLAKAGDAKARRLFEDSLDYVIKAAKHFKYAWPIQFKVDSFEVIVEARNDTGLGQTDVGGLYAYVMLQAHDLLGDDRFLEEAKTAIEAAKGMQFELDYQANLTAWGAVACQRLWKVTGEATYREQACVFLASFFHNSLIWESELKTAKHFHNFLAVTCLHDAPYMAMYECYESFEAFDEFLAIDPDAVSPAARLLMTEYRRFALDRAWSYYPDALPPEAVARDNIRNGHIDRALNFPMEDLYADGQPAGQVGQEIYGCGAAMVFASHAFHRIAGAPFLLFCDYPLRWLGRGAAGFATLKLDGDPRFGCAVRIIPTGKAVGGLKLRIGGKALRGRAKHGFVEFAVPGGAEVQIDWSAKA